ncbi:MAG: APC family permease [Polyangiaceae bacterium]
MTPARAAPARRMTLLPLIGALYFMVSGGPYGLEELAHKVGFGTGIAVLIATPFVWSLPTAFMVGELAAALPLEGGYYAWVRRALGPFWGYQEAWLSLIASVFDMAIYPTLFVLYLGRLSPALTPSPLLIGVLFIAAGAVCNLASAKVVGEESAVMTGLLLAPFAILAALALLSHSGAPAPAPVPAPSHEGAAPDLAGGILVAMWNNMGWDNASTVAGEVDRPQRTYPIAVLTAVALVVLAYVIPMAAMLAAGVDPTGWDTGSWVDVARVYGGAPLAVAVVVGGMVSAFGMFNALCLSYARLPVVLAEDGYLPRIFARRFPKNDAPWVAVIACALMWTLSLGLSFERLVSLDILLYGTSLVLEFVALVVLRVREPELPRPFRAPGGMAGAVLLGLGPLALLAVALVKNADERVMGVNALVFGGGVMVLGWIAYAATAARSRKGGGTSA